MPVVDCHVHLFPPEVALDRQRFADRDAGFAMLYADPRSRFATPEQAVLDMAAAGVDHALVCGFGWTDPGLCAAHNDFLADLIHRYPDRFSACASVQARCPKSTATEIARCAALGFRGVGELMPHLQGYSLDDRVLTDPLAEAAEASGLFVVTHASEPVGHQYPGKGDVWPGRLLDFARDHSRLTIIAAHLGGGLPFYALMPEVASATRNVFYDCAAYSLLYRADAVRIVVECVGADRVVFGSDYPLLKVGRLLGKIRESGLTEHDLSQVLFGNAKRLLGLPESRPSGV